MPSLLKTMKGVGKRALKFGRGLGKRIMSEDFLGSAHRGVAKFNKFAIPALTLGAMVPGLGAVAASAAGGLGAVETGLGVASQLKQVKDAMSQSMGRSLGNSMSVESFHTPNIGAVRAADKTKQLASLLGAAGKHLGGNVDVDTILGTTKKNIGRALMSRIGNLDSDETRETKTARHSRRQTPMKAF